MSKILHKDTKRLTWLLSRTGDQCDRVKATLILGVMTRRAIDIAMGKPRK